MRATKTEGLLHRFPFLPETSRWRTSFCLAYAALWPLAPASLAVVTLGAMNHLWPGMLTWPQFMAVIVPAALLAASGSAIILLALPVRYWARITMSVVGGLIALMVFGVWFDTVLALDEAFFGIAP